MIKKPKILIVGAGLSGLMAALKYCEAGLKVQLVSLLPSHQSDSNTVRSGISVALNPKEKSDSPENHFRETISCGDFLANQKLVLKMCEMTPQLIQILERLGVVFNRTEEGHFDFTAADGSRYFRNLHAGSLTGHFILHALDSQIRRFENQGLVERFAYWEMLSGILDDNGVLKGITALNNHTMEIKIFKADITLVCTGGWGQLFDATTQSYLSQGTAMSRLYQQGAQLANMEMTQWIPAINFGNQNFHAMTHLLISNGARFWVNRDGKPWYFVEEMIPSFKNKAPLDVISRLIFEIIFEKKLGIKGKPLVFLDISHRPSELFQTRLKPVFDTALKMGGIDISKVPLPVSLAYHYGLGGFYVDNNHMTTIPGLFSAGEAQHHYHGASLMEGNLLSASLYSGHHAATHSLYYASCLKKSCENLPDSLFEESKLNEFNIYRDLSETTGPENPYSLLSELQTNMSRHCGVIRHNESLKNTIDKICELKDRSSNICLNDKSRWANQDLITARRLKDMLELALAVVQSALFRNESRGVHFKPAFSEKDTDVKTSKIIFDSKGSKIQYENVVVNDVAVEKRIFD